MSEIDTPTNGFCFQGITWAQEGEDAHCLSDTYGDETVFMALAQSQDDHKRTVSFADQWLHHLSPYNFWRKLFIPAMRPA